MINVFDAWRAQRNIRKTHQQLFALSDHMLSDIGLTRGDIVSVGRDGHVRHRTR